MHLNRAHMAQDDVFLGIGLEVNRNDTFNAALPMQVVFSCKICSTKNRCAYLVVHCILLHSCSWKEFKALLNQN